MPERSDGARTRSTSCGITAGRWTRDPHVCWRWSQRERHVRHILQIQQPLQPRLGHPAGVDAVRRLIPRRARPRRRIVVDAAVEAEHLEHIRQQRSPKAKDHVGHQPAVPRAAAAVVAQRVVPVRKVVEHLAVLALRALAPLCRGRRRGSLAWAQGARDAWARKARRQLRRTCPTRRRTGCLAAGRRSTLRRTHAVSPCTKHLSERCGC